MTTAHGTFTVDARTSRYGDAPIIQVADCGVVTTCEKAVPALIEAIKKIKAAR